MKKIFFVLAVVFTIVAAQAQTDNYKVLKKISVAGEGGWDYLAVDEVAQHIFISHGMEVNVVDVKTDQTIATIPDTKGVHGIAIANDLNKGFISNGRDTSITVFDLKTLQVLQKVKIEGINPDAILYDEFSHKVFSFNGRSNDVTVLDAKTDKIIGTIALTGKPEFAVTNGKGLVYVNIEDKNTITVFDATTLKVKDVWSLKPGEEPTGLAFDKQTKRLFSVCDKIMIVVNAEDGSVVTTVPIGGGCDGVMFDAERKCIYTSNGEGTMTIVKEE
ncbi:MAG TPA: YncE family protein, partial [Bacteroidia bacterium]|nr:YncE family protein [Bacteroidia bacterium]